MFSIGQKVYRNYPAVSSVEGVVGYTKIEHTVVGPSFVHKGKTYVPVTSRLSGSSPCLMRSADLYVEEKK